ncbi:hypothetical protein ARALYDRAFT_327981 [Arabidopsis lyrata subsp. lyrata]|uniref:Uncharacterized protein n=2 Tax=Arabidopsis lyrata subsp. lyrata TaxID=81972 RepID=D7M9M2_ARALL|nr:hypothetical protein ARALYDRAFT_327981 [Arabidopsis lyrata subsp. lyrata]
MVASFSYTACTKFSLLHPPMVAQIRPRTTQKTFVVTNPEQDSTLETQETEPIKEEQSTEKMKKQPTPLRPVEKQLNVKSKGMGQFGGQWLSSVTRHVRIYAAYIDPETCEFDQSQMDKLTLILDPTEEFVWDDESCNKVYSYFQELVDHYETPSRRPYNIYTLRLIGSDVEHYIRKMLFDGEIQYNMDARVLNFSMGKPRVQFNTSNIEGGGDEGQKMANLLETSIFFSSADKLISFSSHNSQTHLLPFSAFINGGRKIRKSSTITFASDTVTYSSITSTEVKSFVEDPMEVEVAEGYTMAQFCDKIIDLFLNEKPKVKQWKTYLVLRDEWNKYSVNFYRRCRIRADSETDPILKQKLLSLESKVKKIDEEMEKHNDLLKEIQENPTDINAIAAKRRRDFTGEFFRYVALLSETLDGLEDRDAVARLATRCLSAVSAYDNTLESVETLDSAQAKFDDILNSPSVDAACEKIRSLAKSKELDSSLILLINSAYAAAKESQTVTNEAKDVMYHLYKATKSSLRSITPKEIKLLKYLLNITDPEERFSALATAFSPGDDHEAKDPKALYTTPKELHKWIKIMLDAYHLNKEETDIKEAKQMSQPIVIQRLFILKDTIEDEYLDKKTIVADENPKKEEDTSVEEFLN